MLVNVFLAGVILIAVAFDLRVRRIPNPLVVIALVFALAYHVHLSGYAGLIFCLKGFGIGILLLLLPFIMGGIGAGDVKLLAVIGAIKGSAFVFSTFLWMAIWGGVIAVIILISRKQLKETVSRLGKGVILAGLGIVSFDNSLRKEEFSVYYPYGVAIALGVLTSNFKGWW